MLLFCALQRLCPLIMLPTHRLLSTADSMATAWVCGVNGHTANNSPLQQTQHSTEVHGTRAYMSGLVSEHN